MAQASFIYVVSSVILVLFGSVSCTSTKCTGKNIDACHRHIKFDEGFCIHYGDMIQCLQEIEENCEDDKLLEELTELKEDKIARGSKCPGMTADCFMEARVNCKENVPINVKNIPHYSEKEKKEDCARFKGKENEARACLKELKSQCNTKTTDRSVEWDLKTIDAIEKICANYN